MARKAYFIATFVDGEEVTVRVSSRRVAENRIRALSGRPLKEVKLSGVYCNGKTHSGRKSRKSGCSSRRNFGLD